ncbi:MAG: YchF-related putative GTPase [Thermoplasmata archaeon]|nr:YchF-related putative GTPase [Thermoplasmata archaeon]
MEIGVVGQPNVGKSTLFNALTLLDVAMAPYPFTTTKPNRGVGAVRVPCPHVEKGVSCSPGNATCVDGVRWAPVNLIDVPGLVPGAHEGRGLGHQFLDDLRPSDGFLQVVDLSGGTSEEGVSAHVGTHDPALGVEWLEDELVEWIAEILGRDFERNVRSLELEGGKLEEFLQRRLTGLAISAFAISAAVRSSGIDIAHPHLWSVSDRRGLARELLRSAKPRLVGANKCDRSTRGQWEIFRERTASSVPSVPCSADAELTLRRAARAHLVRYRPGDSRFEPVPGATLLPAQTKALEAIAGVMDHWEGTGVQRALESLLFERLHRVAVFPVEDESHWTDSRGRVLPDLFLVPADSTVRSVAYRVHTDLGENFLRAIDARTHRALGADHPVSPGAILRIVSKR